LRELNLLTQFVVVISSWPFDYRISRLISTLHMPLAIILGMCSLLLSWDSSAFTAKASNVTQAAQSPENSQQPESQQTSPSLPAAQSDKQPPSPSTEVPDQTKASETKATTKSSQSKISSKKKAASKKRKSSTPSGSGAKPGSEKVVVRNGGTSDPTVQLSPKLSDDQASQKRDTTNDLLTATDTKLKEASGRQLSSAQQDNVAQIRSYIQQAKAATTEGDLDRAHNLAFKAHLLSDELAGH
jgi:hypothetical protein